MNLINIRSGILVLLFISVSVLTLSVYFIHKEVRNMKMVLTKHTHDINSVFGVVGGVASGQMNHLPIVPEQPEQENAKPKLCYISVVALFLAEPKFLIRAFYDQGLPWQISSLD